MAQSAPLAEAWISLRPTLDGASGQIQRELGRVNTNPAGRTAGAAFGGGMVAAARRFVAPLAAVFAGREVFQFFGDAIEEASNLGESVNALDVTFGDASGSVQGLGRDAARSLGLSNVEFNDLAVQFSNFTTTIAGDGGSAVDTLDDLTTRAADFASVMNLEVGDAAGLFQSGLAGETEPLRRYGIDLSAAAVEAYAMTDAAIDLSDGFSESEKVQARYGLLMEQTAVTQGDFANTSDSLANRQRILNASWSNAKSTLGEALLPVAERFTAVLQDTLPYVERLFGWFDSLADTWGPNAEGTAEVSGLMDVFRVTLSGLSDIWHEIVRPAFDDLVELFRSEVSPEIDNFGGVLEEDVRPAMGDLADFMEEYGIPLLGWFAEEGLNSARIFVGDVLPALVRVINYLTGEFSTGMTNTIDTVSFLIDAFNDAKSAGEAIADALKRAFKDSFNAIARAWNGSVGALSFTVPSWVPEIGGQGWSVPDIPMLAEGGIVTRPTLAIIGEGRGPEAVVPLDRADEFGFSKGRSSTMNNTFNLIDPQEIIRELSRQQMRMAV